MDRTTFPSRAGPQACMTCAKAKAKCLPVPSSDVCERCRRLKKPCFPQTPAPPRSRARKQKQTTKKPSRVEALEDRIEELSYRLAAVDGNHMTARPVSHNGSESAAILEVNFETHRDSIDYDNNDYDNNWLGVEEPSMPAFESPGPPRGSSEPPLTPAQILRQTQQSVLKAQTHRTDMEHHPVSTPGHDEEISSLLSRYRTHMQQCFPFVIIPPELANKDQREERPFLWRAVKMAALWQENARHVKLGKRLLKDLTDAILLRPYKSFDVVQGLLVFIAWYHWNLDKIQLTNLLALLQSLCLSLNIGQNTLFGSDHAQNLSDDILDQGRAYCGWYYLSTIVFTMSEKPETCPQTHFIDQLCDNLLSQRFHQPTDRLLVALVKVERLAQSIEIMKTSRKMGGHSGVPLNLIVPGFQQQISNLKESFSEDLMVDEFLRHHFSTVEMILYEVSISDPSFYPFLGQDSTASFRGAGAGGNFLSTFEMQQASTKPRIDLLNACLASVAGFLNNFLSHLDGYMRLGYVASFDMAYCLRLCGNLTELRGIPDWDTNTVKHRLGLDDELLSKHIQDLMDLAAESNTAGVSQSSQYDGDEDAMLSSARKEAQEGVSKHSFERIADGLRSLLSFLRGYEVAGTESSVESFIATPRASYEHGDADEGRDSHFNTMGDIEDQETRSIDAKGGVEPFWQMAAPLPSPSASERASAQTAASLAEMPYSFPAGGFSQISFWPRLLGNEDSY